MKPAILIIFSFMVTAIGRSIYTAGPSVVSSRFDRQFLSPSSHGILSHRHTPLRISARPRFRQRSFGLGHQATFKSVNRPKVYPEHHHAFPSRRRLDHNSHHHGDFFGSHSHRSHRHTLHSEREARRENRRRRRRLRRLIQRHREAEEKAALKEAKKFGRRL